MADTKISALPPVAPVDGDYVVGVDISNAVESVQGTTSRFLFSAIVTYIKSKLGIGDIAGLTDALTGKAAAVHTHEIDQVSGLQDALDAAGSGGGTGGLTSEQVQDLVGAMLDGSDTDGLTVAYDDTAGTITITLNEGVMVRQTPWDASAGTFPTAAQNGYRYRVGVAGTVGGVEFRIDDFLLAIADNASTTVYAANWQREKGPNWFATSAQGAVADTAMVVVTHGADAARTRPAGAPAVYWIGSVAPVNALDNDIWHDTSA